MNRKWPVRVDARTDRDTTKGRHPMVAPRKKENNGSNPVQTKTMFYTEGNPVASLVTHQAGRRTESVMEFPTAEAALGWCRQHGINLFYMAVNISNQ